MTINTKSFMTLSFFILLASACTPQGKISMAVEKAIEENPEIVLKAIEKEPEKFMEVVQKAAQNAQQKLAKQRQEKERQQLEEAFNNPLKPNLTKETAFRGPEDAPITLVEYSDFECPYCKKGMNTVEELRKKYKGKIKFVYKHLPLSFHPNAMPAAQYFEAIKLQSKELAFKFHDEIFNNQSSLRKGEKFLKQTAKKVGANLSKLEKDLNSKPVKEIIAQHVAEAKKFGIQGTPGFVINGVPVKGAYPTDHFVGIINKLKDKGKLAL